MLNTLKWIYDIMGLYMNVPCIVNAFKLLRWKIFYCNALEDSKAYPEMRPAYWVKKTCIGLQLFLLGKEDDQFYLVD